MAYFQPPATRELTDEVRVATDAPAQFTKHLTLTDEVRGHFVAYFQTAQQGASVKAYWI